MAQLTLHADCTSTCLLLVLIFILVFVTTSTSSTKFSIHMCNVVDCDTKFSTVPLLRKGGSFPE